MPVVVTGKTWELRDRLRTLGGRWNADSKGWEFHTLSPEHRAEFTATVGVLIHDKPGAPIPPRQSPRYSHTELQPPRVDVEKLISDVLDDIDNEPPQRSNGSKSNIFGDDQSWFNYFYDQNPTGFFGFSSLSAMTKYIEGLPENRRNGQGWKRDRAQWAGSECIPDAIDIARKGWADGVEMAQEVHQALIGQHARERRRKHNVAGGSVNVGRLLAGNPAHMLARPKQPGTKVVTFFVEAFMSMGIDADNAIIRAALIGAIADILEMNGYSCEIVSIATARVDNVSDRGAAYQIATMLKAAGETLDLNDVIFGLGHPSYFRRFCFACVGSDRDLRRTWPNMGFPAKAFHADNHPPKANEFFVDKIPLGSQRRIDDDAPLITKAMQIWDLITDGNLPVELNREEIDA